MRVIEHAYAELSGNFWRLICRAVVHHYHFERGMCLTAHVLKTFADAVSLVIGSDDDRDFGSHR